MHFTEQVCVLMIDDTIYYSALQPTSAIYHRYEYENSGLALAACILYCRYFHIYDYDSAPASRGSLEIL